MENLELWYRLHKDKIISGTSSAVFYSNGSPITSWSITGAEGGVGDTATAPNAYQIPVKCSAYHGNLFDVSAVTPDVTIDLPDAPGDPAKIVEKAGSALSDYIDISAETYITLSFTHLAGYVKIQFEWCDADKNTISMETFVNLAPAGVPIYRHSQKIDNTNSAAYFRFAYDVADVDKIMVNEGETEYPYSDYIAPKTTCIYIDEPLDAGDTLTYADTGTAIETLSGKNVLTFLTEVQPSEVSLQPVEMSESMAKYFGYNYGVRRSAGGDFDG